MPQKKNPDGLELLRGKCGRSVGNLTSLLVTLKGLPSTYNKDLQEDKVPMFDSAETLMGSLDIASGILSTLDIFPDKMGQALGSEMLATDVADYLVRKGVPFRESHHISGQAVQLAENMNMELSELTAEDLSKIHEAFEDDVTLIWSMESSVESRSATGGTGRVAVEEQINILRDSIRQ
jgi:argininosuccinate lyase